MAKKFAELEARMTPESRARAESIYEQHIKEMPLHELRQAYTSWANTYLLLKSIRTFYFLKPLNKFQQHNLLCHHLVHFYN